MCVNHCIKTSVWFCNEVIICLGTHNLITESVLFLSCCKKKNESNFELMYSSTRCQQNRHSFATLKDTSFTTFIYLVTGSVESPQPARLAVKNIIVVFKYFKAGFIKIRKAKPTSYSERCPLKNNFLCDLCSKMHQ